MSGGCPARWAAYASERVPRYTSYPTANHFGPGVGAARYREWLGSLDLATPLSLYVHVPFCRKLCLYCGCAMSVVSRHKPIGAFVADLIAEIDLITAALPGRFTVEHLHFGGGTPTALAPEEFTAIARRLGERFAMASGAEIAVEIDPRGFDDAMAAALAGAGVTRASLGVQDFDPEVQRAVNRMQPASLVAETIGRLRRSGIGRISFDLLYGLPQQTVESVARTAALAAAMQPDRMALFGYAHVPWMKPHQKTLERHGLPDADARWDMARAAERTLVQAGYARVGMDHFALPGDALAVAAREGRLHRNFQGYTADACKALLAFGPSGISSLPQGYAQAPADLAAWRASVRRGELAVARGKALDADDRLRRAVIERLMCDMAVDLDQVALSFGRAPGGLFAEERARLRLLAAEGLVEFDGSSVAMAEQARPLVRAVAAVFDAYLARGAQKHAVAV